MAIQIISMPKDAKGRFISNKCPNPLCGGTLQPVDNRNWACDGLVDPDHPDKDLEACTHTHSIDD